jgi:hypothetical protein
MVSRGAGGLGSPTPARSDRRDRAVSTEAIERDLLEGEGGQRRAGHADLTQAAASRSSRPSIRMRRSSPLTNPAYGTGMPSYAVTSALPLSVHQAGRRDRSLSALDVVSGVPSIDVNQR